MTTAEIAEERRRGRLAGPAAIAAAILLAVAIVWSAIVNHDRPDGKDDDAERLRFFDDHAAGLVGVSVVRAIGFGLLVFAIIHLQRAMKARNPELTSTPLVVGVGGALALTIGIIGQAIALADEASSFVTREFPSDRAADKAAEDATSGDFPLITSVFAFGGTLALAFWFVLGSLNAMRIGLLTRFMGILGIIVGPGFVFGFAPPVMVFWLIALGALFLGYWPRGLPPAWEAGEAIPWPKQGRAEAAEPDGAPTTPNGEVNAVGPGVRKAEAEAGEGGQPRRKRKRRR